MPATVREPPPAAAGRSPGTKLIAAVVVVAVLVGLVLTVFGSATSKIVDPVAKAATLSSSAPGYRMRMSIEIASSALPTPVTGVGNGSFDVRDRAGSVSLTMNLGSDPRVIQALGSSTLRIDEILNGTKVYVKLPEAVAGTLRMLGKQWIEVDLAKIAGVPGLSSLSSDPASGDPSQMLQYLRAVSDSIVAEGRARVGGLETTHYRAELSLDRVPDALPSADRAAAQQALSTVERMMQVHEIPVDVWVDAHHMVRRIQMTLDASVPNGQTMRESIVMDISHYGPQPRPTPPPADEVQDVSRLMGAGG
jgi:hypothetical protein